MKTSKITEIVKTNEWESKYGPMYSITLKMENSNNSVIYITLKLNVTFHKSSPQFSLAFVL